MFLIDDQPIPYVPPWDLPLSVRLARLRHGEYRVAYFYERPDSSTFRYRVYNMVQALEAGGSRVVASYFGLGDLGAMDEIVESCDAVVLCRTGYDEAVNRFIGKAKGRRRKILFDVDDLVFDTRYTPLLIHALDEDAHESFVWEHWFASCARLNTTLQACDYAIVTNDYLGARLRETRDIPTSVIPNFLNLEQVTTSDTIYAEKRRSGFARNENIHVGYFSGTPTHNKDFALVIEALRHLLREDPRVILRLAGHLPVPDALREFDARVERHAFRDFVNLQTLIGSTEINLVPLQDTVFSHCKSDLKFFEAAAAGTLTVASPTEVYGKSISDGVDGYLANSFEWAEKIGRVVDKVGTIDDYASMAETARNRVRAKYHWSAQAPAIEQAIAA
jgi:glycosyltransferase involved in cell wall biosynthesis